MKQMILLFLILFYIGCGNHEEESSNTSQHKSPIEYQKITFNSIGNFKLLKKMTASPFDLDVIAETEEEKNEYINKQIPDEIKAFDQTNIEITGYAFPVQLNKGVPNAIVLMRIAPNCCFGDVLQLNELIYVDIPKPKLKIRENHLINVKGKLTVNTKQLENQTSRFMYWIKADEVSFEKK